MFKTLMQNLSRNQKIAIAVILQLILILIIATCINWAFQPKQYVSVENENSTSIPDANWNGIKNELWYLIQDNVENVSRADIDDAVVREGTYEEKTENDITTATFLLDIDSLKQTYFITTSWSDKVELSDAMSIDCPPIDQMKYPETECYGMYNNTHSLNLYLPHSIMAPHNNEAVDIFIQGDESNHEISISVANCKPEELKRKAIEYLESTPIDLSKYKIVYDVYELEYPYFDEAKMSAEEIDRLQTECRGE